MKNKVRTRVGRTVRFKTILQSDMTASNKSKLFLKIYGKALGHIPVYLALIALSVVFLVPFLYMIGHSFMTASDLLNPNIKWLPRSLNFNNYVYAFESMDYWYYLGKTILVVGISVFAQIMSSAFVAYGLARVKFKGSGVIFGIVLFMLIVPPQTIIVPSYILFSNAHLVDSYIPIVLPCFFAMGLNGGMIIFVFRQFFKGMPAELENAAMIDGTGIFGAYFRVIFPNVKPAILITGILSMVWQWNNSFEPSIYIEDSSKGLLNIQLRELQQSVSNVMQGVDFNQGINMAGTLLTILPIVIIFLAVQGRFMKSMAESGLAN